MAAPPPAAGAATCCTGLLLAHRSGLTCLGIKSPAEEPADHAARAAHHALRGLQGAPVGRFSCAGASRYDTTDAAALLAAPPICAGFELLSIAAAAEAAARAGDGGDAAGAERPLPLAAAFVAPPAGAKAPAVEVVDITILNSLLASARRNAAAAWRTAAALATGGGGSGEEPESA